MDGWMNERTNEWERLVRAREKHLLRSPVPLSHAPSRRSSARFVVVGPVVGLDFLFWGFFFFVVVVVFASFSFL